MSEITTFNVSRAAHRSRVKLDETNLTTLDFGQIVPLYSRSILPSDEFNIKFNIFSRTAPLAFPAYIDSSLRAVTAFVPYYQVSDYCEPFFQGQSLFNSNSVFIPTITAYELDVMFCFKTNSLLYPVSSVSEDFDINILSHSNQDFYEGKCKFTRKGKYFYKVLTSLGYQLSEGITFNSSSNYFAAANSLRLNALPLLCFLKLYKDWFSSIHRFATSVLGNLLNKYKTANTLDSTKINSSDLFTMLNSVLLMYDDDYFTTAWRHPNSSATDANNINPPSIFMPTGYPDTPSAKVLDGTTRDTITTIDTSGSDGVITSTQMRLLASFDKFIRRNNYAGTKPAMRALSRFGIKTSDLRSNYADVLNVKSIPLNIGDVTQTSEGSEQSPLASYSGKGILNGSDSQHCKFSDYGQLFVIGYINVKTFYPYGYDADILKSKYYEFYLPEFDGVAPKAISFNELSSNPRCTPVTQYYVGCDVFGFTELYNEYRSSRNHITGDFLTDPTLRSWHSARFHNFRNQALKAQSGDVIYYPNDEQSEFNRIFALNDSELSSNDHFFISSYFDITAVRPIKDLTDSINLGQGSITMDKSGNSLN